MASETLKITDVIVPSEFLEYVVQRTNELSLFWSSGIVATDAQFATIAAGGGQTVTMPFWNDLAGDDQILTDQAALETKKIGTGSDVAVIHNRGDAWATNDLASLLATGNPGEAMSVIGDLVADYWARKHQGQLINTTKGVFAAASMSGNLLDIHATSSVDPDVNCLNGLTFIDAKQKLGDAKAKLTAIAMHSAVEASLLKQDLIDFIPVSEGKEMLATFQGARVIVDDGMPNALVSGFVQYTSVLYGQGAFAHGVSPVNDVPDGASPGSTWQLEFGRDVLSGVSQMVNRRRFILHPRGIKWTGNTMTGPSPTNAELATAANWLRVIENKSIRMVAVHHNIVL
jgi:hypothetical protein